MHLSVLLHLHDSENPFRASCLLPKGTQRKKSPAGTTRSEINIESSYASEFHLSLISPLAHSNLITSRDLITLVLKWTSMPPLLEPATPALSRPPRTFFTSALIIQPKPTSTLPNGPITNDALAPLKSPRQVSSNDQPLLQANRSNKAPDRRKTTSTESRIKDKGKGLDKKIAGSLDSKGVAIGNTGPPIWADRAAKAREARIVKLAKLAEEKRMAAERSTSPASSNVDQPRRTRRASMAASVLASTSRTAQTPIAPTAGHTRQSTNTTNASTDLSSPPPLMLKISKKAINAASNAKDDSTAIPFKEYMEAGFYCQHDQGTLSHNLVEKVLLRRQAEENAKSRPYKKGGIKVAGLGVPAFPPLPYDYGYELFFGEEQDFVLPFNIRREAESGQLDGKKKPAAYSKLRASKCWALFR
jgi:hypothetical protein